jgi:hypothetical protein
VLYILFMLWMVASISVVLVSMVLGGLLCAWCAFIGRKRLQLDMATLAFTTRCPTATIRPTRSSTSLVAFTTPTAATTALFEEGCLSHTKDPSLLQLPC